MPVPKQSPQKDQSRRLAEFVAPRALPSRLLFALALALVFLLLVLPNRIDSLNLAQVSFLPLELPALILVLALMPVVLLPIAVGIAAGLLVLTTVFKLADMAAFEALARPFNPILDLHLLDAVWVLMTGSLGLSAAWGVLFAVVVIILLLLAIAFWSVFNIGRMVAGRRRIAAVGAGLVLSAGLALTHLAPDTAASRFVAGRTSHLVQLHAASVTASLKDIQTFTAEAAVDPVEDIAPAALAEGLEGRDVMMAFVESYGRTVIDRPDYRATVLPILNAFGATVDGLGLHATSGYLTSPIVGGQSWLAHATALSGLRIDSQRRYTSLLVSRRSTLVADFAEAGYRSVAVMPAITMAWPEGEFFGYDAIHAEAGLGYRGLPFNWVTMPDQYTLTAFDRLERLREDRPPLFAEIALISSHAPWTPIPTLIEWDEVGTGEIFNEQAQSGDTPEEVWREPERVRTQFRLSIEYALTTLRSYVAERLDRPFVLVILGDHQPARIVTGETDNRDVPFHVISDDADLVARVQSAFSSSAGMQPGPAPAHPMAEFRERFLRAVSGEGGGETAPDGTVFRRPDSRPI
jgi:hypothetical protein